MSIKSKYINEKYIPMIKDILSTSFDDVDPRLIEDGIRYSIEKRLKLHPACINNDYKGFNIETNLLEISDIIYDKKPILTSHGVLYQHHGTSKNVISNILTKFLDTRNRYKKERKKYPKGSPEFAHYDLAQLLEKISANSLYGVQGMSKSLFYNIHVATSITSTGQSLISASGLFFEMFLNNNVKLSSLDEMMGMLHNIVSEKGDKRIYKDSDILDFNIDVDTCFSKVIMLAGFNWIPTEREMNIVYNYISRLGQEDINRIYYKNNLYEFLYNEKPKQMLRHILSETVEPMIFPTDPPKNVKEEIDELMMMVEEYVYYGYQVVDRLDKYSRKIRSVAIITDTDSVIVSLDFWYRFVLEITKDIDLPLRYIKVNEFDAINGEAEPIITNKETDDSDKAIKQAKAIDPDRIPPQECLRYTILNIMAYMLDRFVNEYMINYVKSCNALHPKAHCLMVLKNEFLFKRVLVKAMRKNYASIQELQEGTIVPSNKSLDIKGLPLNKSTLKPSTRERLKFILKEYILDIDEDELSQSRVLKELKKFEDEIYQSLRSGSKEYYKPAVVKPSSNYDDPLSIQGVKASVVFNIIKNKYDDPINLDDRNSLSIVKIDINKKNIYKIKEINEEIYNELQKLLSRKEFKTGIKTVAVSDDASLPEWVMDFINYKEIISDNLKNFPLEDIGINRGRDTNPYTNIISF